MMLISWRDDPPTVSYGLEGSVFFVTQDTPKLPPPEITRSSSSIIKKIQKILPTRFCLNDSYSHPSFLWNYEDKNEKKKKKKKKKIYQGISSSVLSVFFTDKFALSQSDARISVAYKICQWKTLTKTLDEMPPCWRLVPSIFRLGSMGNVCYNKIKMSSAD